MVKGLLLIILRVLKMLLFIVRLWLSVDRVGLSVVTS